MAGEDLHDAASLERSRTILQGGPLPEVTTRLAAAILEHTKLGPARTKDLASWIEISNGDQIEIRNLQRIVAKAASTGKWDW